jgi:Tfp pilus assembly protein PilX
MTTEPSKGKGGAWGCITTYADRPFMCSTFSQVGWRRSSLIAHPMCGAALVASLLFLALLTMIGLAAVSTTLFEFRISSNYRNATALLHLAEAGVEHAREVLRVLNAGSADPASFTDELLLAAGNNGELNGFVSATDDVPLIPVTVSPLGSAYGSYTVYLTNDTAEQSNVMLDSNGRVTLIAIAKQPSGATRVVENVVMRYGGPALQAALYGKENVRLDDATNLVIDGNDRCLLAASLPPIYTLQPALAEQLAPATLLGAPQQPQQGLEDIDIRSHLNFIKTGAADLIVLTDDQDGISFGTASHYVTVYSNTSNPSNTLGLQIVNGSGYGILLVEGDLTLSGNFDWHGLLLVTGHLTLDGGSGSLNIGGAILAQGTTAANGSVEIQYDSCAINRALNNQALITISWKEAYH